MHLMHLIFLAGNVIGYFHTPSIIVTAVMTVAGIGLIVIFFKIFERDLFGEQEYDRY